jgi:hypothetical protein
MGRVALAVKSAPARIRPTDSAGTTTCFAYAPLLAVTRTIFSQPTAEIAHRR